jgi:hypothetical protein
MAVELQPIVGSGPVNRLEEMKKYSTMLKRRSNFGEIVPDN